MPLVLTQAMVKPQAPSKPFPNSLHSQREPSPPVTLKSQVHEPSKDIDECVCVEQKIQLF